jgi:hypothetical protein
MSLGTCIDMYRHIDKWQTLCNQAENVQEKERERVSRSKDIIIDTPVEKSIEISIRFLHRKFMEFHRVSMELHRNFP